MYIVKNNSKYFNCKYLCCFSFYRKQKSGILFLPFFRFIAIFQQNRSRKVAGGLNGLRQYALGSILLGESLRCVDIAG
jgi:hypothetical protein